VFFPYVAIHPPALVAFVLLSIAALALGGVG
jgi:hypothetical protein